MKCHEAQSAYLFGCRGTVKHPNKELFYIERGIFYRFLADIVLILHFAFVLFVVLGALFIFRWPRLLWLHLPAAAWGTIIEFAGWRCPLTPLEVTCGALVARRLCQWFR